MKGPSSTGRSAMRASGRLLFLFLLLIAATSRAAEAPPSPPPEAEAGHQDLDRRESPEIWLDEAVFTEISPLTVPEVGIALPPDQAL